jgi:alkanesulfonate monooxygenase
MFINILPYGRIDESVDLSGRMGFDYTLVPVGAQRLDPWIVAQYGMERSRKFSPIIAMNPAYQHPVEAAKRILTLQAMYPNKISLNCITGSYANEMQAVGDGLDFPARCRRLKEYLLIVGKLLRGLTTFSGEFYQVKEARVLTASPRHPIDLFVSGSFDGDLSDMGMNIYKVRNLRPDHDCEASFPGQNGVHFGILARSTREQAERDARTMFVEDRKGEFLFNIAIQNHETPWNEWLRSYLKTNSPENPDYFLKPLMQFRSFAPYVVASYDEIAIRLERYISRGDRFFILDFQQGEESHVNECLKRVKAQLSLT